MSSIDPTAHARLRIAGVDLESEAEPAAAPADDRRPRTAGAPSGPAEIAWLVLVSALAILLVLSLLSLVHVLGHRVSDDRLVTMFTGALAGLLGLFVRGPGR